MLEYDKVVARIELIRDNMRENIKEAVCQQLSIEGSNLADAKQGIGQVIGVDFFAKNLLSALEELRED